MTEKKKRTPSIQALENIKEILKEQCLKAHGFFQHYGDEPKNCTDAKKNLDAAKDEMITKISKEIEEYVVKTYKKYGIAVVPVCHRKDSGADRLKIDLKMKVFPGLENLEKAEQNAYDAFRADLKKIDAWYYAALQAVTKREDLPAVPEFHGTGMSEPQEDDS